MFLKIVCKLFSQKLYFKIYKIVNHTPNQTISTFLTYKHVHYIIYTCNLKERITVFLERVKGRKKLMHDTEEGMRDGWVFSGVLCGM